MRLRKFWFALGFGLLFLGTLGVAASFAQEPEEPLLPYVSQDFDTAATAAGQVAAAAIPQGLLRPPTNGDDGDETQIVVGPNKIVNDPQSLFPAGLIGRSETAVTSDEEGNNVVVGWNDADGFLSKFALGGVSGWAFSADASATFLDGGGMPPTTIPTSPPTTVVVAGDPWLEEGGDEDGDGTDDGIFLFSNLAVRANIAGNGPGTPHGTEGVTVHRGTVTNGVLTWGTPTLIPSPSAAGTFGLDKEAIAADKRRGAKAVYVTATNFDVSSSPINGIVAFHSTDGGVTFSGPALVQSPGADGVQGSEPVVGPNGEVYVVWERGRFNIPPAKARIQFSRSTDGGATFSPAVDVAAITAAARKPPAGYNRSRHNDFPRVAVALGGPHLGRIFVTYQDVGSNPDLPGIVTLTGAGNPALPGVADADVFLKYSDDGGTTWSAPVSVNGAIGDGKAQFWPVVNWEGDDKVDVVYYEDVETNLTPDPTDIETSRGLDGVAGRTRRSTRSSMVDVFLARSTNGGASFGTPVKVTDFTSNWSATRSNIIPNMGDYIASSATETEGVEHRILAAWADSRVSINILPSPGVFLSPIPSVAFAAVDVMELDRPAGTTFANLPKTNGLGQNYPNPFNPSTSISFALSEPARVELKVYNILGQEVKSLLNNQEAAGAHQVVWDGKDASGKSVSSGIYLYKLVTPSFVETKKMTLMK